MSKKGKNKLKKMHKARIIQESISAGVGVTETSISQESTESQDIMANVLSKKGKFVVPPKENLLPETAYVKYEIKKIAIVFGIILVLLIAVTIVDSKTGIVLKMADSIARLFK